MECPGCGGYSSSVLGRVRDGEPCPFCGLSAQAILEINEVRAKKADEGLKARLEEALKRVDKAETEAAKIRGFFVRMRDLLDGYEKGETDDRW